MADRSFQGRVVDWMMETFSMQVCRDTAERNHRFLEESLELVQALGCTAAEAHMLVDYTFGRPTGEPQQEVGGVMVTLAALCSAADFSMTGCALAELARCWQNIAKIRAKQAAKPPSSPLPGSANPLQADFRELLIAGYAVANAIHAGAGGMIKGTLMEKEFRDALALLPGELIDIKKLTATGGQGVKNAR
jgi:hypothetical protein